MSYQITLFFLLSLGFLGLIIRIEVFHFNLIKQKHISLAQKMMENNYSYTIIKSWGTHLLYSSILKQGSDIQAHHMAWWRLPVVRHLCTERPIKKLTLYVWALVNISKCICSSVLILQTFIISFSVRPWTFLFAEVWVSAVMSAKYTWK